MIQGLLLHRLYLAVREEKLFQARQRPVTNEERLLTTLLLKIGSQASVVASRPGLKG
jgi:hypothetical protein